MKPCFSIKLRGLLMSVLCAGVTEAAVRHTDVSLDTYVDFANNAGRYVAGVTNAMLDYLRERDGGVLISYTAGQPDYTMEHGMIDFDAVSDMGNMTVVGYNYAVTVAHNSSQMAPTFTRNDYGIGIANSQKYLAVEEYGAAFNFVHHQYGENNDYKISRLTKLVTDVTPAQMTGGAGSDYKGKLVYRVGGGLQQLRDENGNTDESIQDVYLVGGMAHVNAWWNSATSEDVRLSTVTAATSWNKGEGGGAGTPLPFGGAAGDSGSPYYVWEDGSYKLLSVHVGSSNGEKQTHACEATDWAQEVMDADTVRVNMGLVKGTLNINGAEESTDKGSKTDEFNGVSVDVAAAKGFLTHDEGNLYDEAWNAVSFSAIATGQHTWKSLSGLKNTNNWYAYGNEYLSATPSVVIDGKDKEIATGVTYAKLFLTQNMRFDSADDNAEYTIGVTEDTDLGAGYLHFAANGHRGVQYHVVSEDNNLLNSAGYVVDAGVRVNVSLRNTDADYMREWRKVGDGELRICGEGNNEIFLNVGGSGRTVLEQKNGYAAYNVIVNTGSTLVISDTAQIARDLTLGNGGGTLDMNGNSMDWYMTDGEKRSGFTIHALTEEALVANSRGQSTLRFLESGNQTFVGSFVDSEQGALTVDYQGGGVLTLHSIRTQLGNKDSGLTVTDGTVTLSGTLTVHGYGTVHTRETADFATRENDWHYADAAMNVTVKNGGVFELGSHARLVGSVTVESGGMYTMHEGVQHAEEYVEGGDKTENTAELEAYFGHKGDVRLAEGAEMKVVFSEGTDTGMSYSGNISGPGTLIIALGTDEASFTLGGSVSGLSKLVLRDNSTVYVDSWLDAESLEVEDGSELLVQGGAEIASALTTSSSQEQVVAEPLTLLQYGGEARLVLEKDSRGLVVFSSLLRGVSLLEGSSLYLDMTGLGDVSGMDYICVNFNERQRSQYESVLSAQAAVTATLEDGRTLVGYYAAGNNGTVYFAMVPEPTTGALTLLALTLLCARRRR